MGPRQGRMSRPPGMMEDQWISRWVRIAPQSEKAAEVNGLLSRLFQRKTTSQAGGAASGFTRASSGASTLQGLANPQTISSFLTIRNKY